jgi:hypothetical protein
MNNSDHNDFKNWQNGDDGDMNNPNNNPNGFFFYGNMSPKFREMWNKINNGEDINDSIRDYLNIDDIMNEWIKQPNPTPQKNNRRPQRNNNKKVNTTLSQDEYMKLIEIRGYLNITEQYAHVKALDKLLNQIIIFPKGPNQ